MSSAAALSADRLTLHIQKRPILRDVSAIFPAGKITALIGPNGAGKSTLLKVLAGILPADAGQIQGRGASKLEHSKACVWLPPSTQVAFNFRVFDVVRMGLYPWHQGRPSRKDDDATMAALTHVCASELADRSIGQLSSGERQRVMLARALVGPAQFLLLDEPLTNLDLQTSYMVLDILREKAKTGVGIVISLHDLALATELTDDFVCMKHGHVVASGSLRQALTQGLAEQAFGVHATQHSGRWFISGIKG